MQYQALYAVIGNIYGGKAQQQTFTLPNLMGYAPVGTRQGTGLLPYTLGTPAGQASVPLSQPNLPPHTHSVTVKIGNPGTALINNVFLSNPTGADLNLPATRANSTANYTTLCLAMPLFPRPAHSLHRRLWPPREPAPRMKTGSHSSPSCSALHGRESIPSTLTKCRFGTALLIGTETSSLT
jgi:hypothetical protein